MSDSSGEQSAAIEKWQDICRREHEAVAKQCAAVFELPDGDAFFRWALSRAGERNSALRLLLQSYSEDRKRLLFPQLVETVAFESNSIFLGRATIKSISLNWVRSKIMPVIDEFLSKVSHDPNDTEEAYRRFGELLREIDLNLLKVFAEKALEHSSAAVREVGRDMLEWN